MNTADVKIFDFRKQDAADVLQIQNETNLSFWSENDYLSELERDDSVFKVARNDGGNIIGFALVRLLIGNSSAASVSFDSAEILNIAVHRSFQNAGIGQMIFDEILRELGAKNIKEIWLEVRSSNFRALAFYRKNDFEMQFERKNYYSNPAENALVFRRTIKKKPD